MSKFTVEIAQDDDDYRIIYLFTDLLRFEYSYEHESAYEHTGVYKNVPLYFDHEVGEVLTRRDAVPSLSESLNCIIGFAQTVNGPYEKMIAQKEKV